MKITKLSLTNYRGVQSLSLDFHDKLNVFFGINGAGKSTILDATAIMLSWVANRIQRSGNPGRHISESDIANGKNFSSIDVCCSHEGQNIEWKLSKSRKGRGQPEDPSNLKDLNDFAKEMQTQIATNGEDNTALPLFVYYPVNRSVLDIPLRIKGKHTFDIFAAYDRALTSGADFRTFFEWFREREDLENENRRHAESLFEKGGPAFPDPQLEAVRNALKMVLPEFANLSVRRHPLRMEVQKDGETLKVDQLSDGEKCLIAMIGDLARRMAIANPTRENPLEGEGIVLIDEIDLHLHPKWQRMIVPKILAVFPNCQFVISTHSPHVLTHMKQGSLYLLEHTDSGIKAERMTEAYGKTVDRVLEDLMGLKTTRPDEISAALRDIYEEIDRSNLEAAKQRIEETRIEIGNDPELVKAEVLIKRKELIGK
jgi:predicted ATP-binding protein involved in virulence